MNSDIFIQLNSFNLLSHFTIFVGLLLMTMGGVADAIGHETVSSLDAGVTVTPVHVWVFLRVFLGVVPHLKVIPRHLDVVPRKFDAVLHR